jgi:tyrosinase
MAKSPRKRAPKARPASASPTHRRRPIGSPKRPKDTAKIFVSKPVPIDFAGPEHRFNRADLEIDGIFHGEASYEGRVFFNNPKANASTPKTAASGYAGSFHIFGHGGCFGDVGHCDVDARRQDIYDFRPPHPLTPAKKRITVTEPLRTVAKTAKQVTVTVVPVATAANALCDTKNLFRCKDMRFVTYDP